MTRAASIPWSRRMRVAALCLAIVATGCNAIGPRALQSGRINYNEAIAQTWNEQLLRNLVRLRYRDTLVFLEVSSVSTQYSVSYSAGASGSFIGAGANDALGLDAGGGLAGGVRPVGHGVSARTLGRQKMVLCIPWEPYTPPVATAAGSKMNHWV